MSEAFPYIQSSAQKNFILKVIENKITINKNFELTSVVGNFLSWDETGGHNIIRKFGNSGLPKILNTDKNFHANMLKKDIFILLNKNVISNYSKDTSKYLKELLKNLESFDDIKRSAYMVAFENHAEIMIEALWTSLSLLFNEPKDNLMYFKVHVGEDDPAEMYHIQMTEKLINNIVTNSDENKRFIESFKNAYKLNYEWCVAIKKEKKI